MKRERLEGNALSASAAMRGRGGKRSQHRSINGAAKFRPGRSRGGERRKRRKSERADVGGKKNHTTVIGYRKKANGQILKEGCRK